MTRQRKGASEIEFVVATALFLSAFWFIYMQSAFMLAPSFQRHDIRAPATEFYSGYLISDAGYPLDWDDDPTLVAFAKYEDGVARPGILDKKKLDWVVDNNKSCSEVNAGVMAGMEFAFRVTTAVGSWECVTGVPKEGAIKRPVFVQVSNGVYRAGVLEVWAA